VETISRWVQESVIMRIIITALRPETYEESYVGKFIAATLKNVSGIFRGSFLRFLSFDVTWEKSAVDHSRFVGALLKTGPQLKAVVNHINQMIRGSLLLVSALKVEGLFMEKPLVILGYVLFPAIFVSTALKALFSSFTPNALVLRLVLMALSFAMAFLNIPLDKLLCGSKLLKAVSLMIGEKSEVLFGSEARDRGAAFDKTVRLLLLAAGIMFGSFYYFLPGTTFMKLFGLIFLSVFIYLKPWWGLYMVAFMLPLTATTYSVAIIGLTFVSIFLNHDRFKVTEPIALVPALMFMATAVLAAVFSLMRAESLKNLPLYAAYFMVFYSAAVLLRDRIVLKTAIFCLAISSFLLSAYGIYQYFFVKVPTAMAWVDIEQFPELATRVYATLENPNVLAEYLVLVIPVTLGALWTTGKFARKAIYAGLTGALILCLVLTFSRGAWLGLVLALVVFAILKEPRLFILFMVLALIFPLFMPTVVLDRIASIGSMEDSSNAFRVTIWIAAFRMIKDYWLTGIGLGLSAFARVYRDYMIAGTPAQHAHNLYLEMGIEIGIAGVLAFLWMIASGLARALDRIKTNDRYSFILAGVVGALGGHLLHGLFDYVWYSPRIVMAFWLVFGMMAALSSLEKSFERGRLT